MHRKVYEVVELKGAGFSTPHAHTRRTAAIAAFRAVPSRARVEAPTLATSGIMIPAPNPSSPVTSLTLDAPRGLPKSAT
jgi:hypothetical protein